jgi:ribonuclease HIII
MPGDPGPLPAPGSPAGPGAGPAVTDPEELVPHIGTDEAGKGDYFGPLVCAACYLDADMTRTLRALGIRDSKTPSDRRIRALAGQIRARLPGRFAVVTLPPPRYNSLYEELRREGENLNSLVGWGHARAIQDLPERGVRAEYAVIDKFAGERYLHERLRADARHGDRRLEHRTKAESDVAVAAASILARDRFAGWLDEASEALGTTLPKGSRPARDHHRACASGRARTRHPPRVRESLGQDHSRRPGEHPMTAAAAAQLPGRSG